MTDEEEARSAFDRLRLAVDAAPGDISPEVAWHVASELGLQGPDLASEESGAWSTEHLRSWPGGLEIVLHVRWWDPSGTHPDIPDRHVLTLTLRRVREVLAEHSAAYDE